ncbi:hypothetical protein BC349_12255 [Flavihumibacter stibioxidans]|uniref:DUF5060 domain-containing protein n=2 Tax=Flavihumibacter stibioxidans TaxID=1834163 RepID=A0ABR7M9X5_9BACT|nr:hypothetical protein [Flavihumibacter stibioxidans]
MKLEAGEHEYVAQQYHPIDIVFSAGKHTAGNPFDLRFGAIFTDDRNTTITTHGFYNGQNEYLIRFSPNQTGKYLFVTFSTQKYLSGLSGTVNVGKNINPEIHGAVQVSAEAKQKFKYQDWQSYFALSFEPDWHLFKGYQSPWKGQSAVLIINGK